TGIVPAAGAIAALYSFQSPRQKAPNFDDIALADAQVDICDPGGLVVRPDHATAVFLLQLGDAADMVAVMMGDEDVRQCPALALQRLENRLRFRRVDRGGRPGRRIVNQVADIVGGAGDQANFGSHDTSVIWQDPNAGMASCRHEIWR